MNIIITGGAGFIGSHLAEKLLNLGNLVVCIDNFDNFYNPELKRKNISSLLLNKNFILQQLDIRDFQQIKECFKNFDVDLVIHLAAKAGVRPSIQDPLGYFNTNVMGTLNILEAMRLNRINKMIFASSSSVYGNNSKVPFAENDQTDFPISPYASTKKSAESLCYTYHHLYNFKIFCLRLFTVYGPRQRPDLAIHKFTNSIINNEPITIYGNGYSARDYTYIDDIINGFEMAINYLDGFEIINLGESRTITLNRMVETLENELGKKAQKIYLPDQPGDVKVTYADISKARKILNYRPTWEFEKGIKKFIEWKLK